MQRLLFTKLFGPRPVSEIGPVVADLGFDGIDLLVRGDCTVSPTEGKRIPSIVEEFRSFGLTVPMATTDLTDPSSYPADVVLGGCAEAGLRLVRLGFWPYGKKLPARSVISEAQRNLDSLEILAARHGVRLAIQLHGFTVHASGALTYQLLADRDPALLGAYPDPGNQFVQNGSEDWRLTFDLLAPWLACVGVKNGGWFPVGIGPSGDRRWESQWLGPADGGVPWPAILAYLQSQSFDGPLTLHSPYKVPYEHILDQTRLDLKYLDRLLVQAVSPDVAG